MNDLSSLLKINQLVQIELIHRKDELTRYPSRVENFDENSFTIVAPMKDRASIILPEGTPVNIWFWNSEAVYVFHTYLLKNTMTSVHRIILAKPKVIERVQQREYVRVSFVMEVLLSYFNSQGEEEVIRCKSKNISGGGMMLVLNTYIPLQKEAKIQIQFILDEDLIKIEGEIVCNEWELDNQGIEHNLIRVKFTQISERHRKIIIKNVYLRQIELKKKGLL
ncbi:MAG: flagellar brake domain-containing protein [Clostridia bacterium]|nr:flagellar brake domain-containing protein [Clostridia bacterium]MDD4145543.1 flagellar brake domain-containing protein [Clostridia bacterium]MDD4664981.1 flagellar brake domain-containing protein [Clostridia bacterium]